MADWGTIVAELRVAVLETVKGGIGVDLGTLGVVPVEGEWAVQGKGTKVHPAMVPLLGIPATVVAWDERGVPHFSQEYDLALVLGITLPEAQAFVYGVSGIGIALEKEDKAWEAYLAGRRVRERFLGWVKEGVYGRVA